MINESNGSGNGSRGMNPNQGYGHTDIHALSNGVFNPQGRGYWHAIPHASPVHGLPQSYGVNSFYGTAYALPQNMAPAHQTGYGLHQGVTHGFPQVAPYGIAPAVIPFGLTPAPVQNFAPINVAAFQAAGLPQALPTNGQGWTGTMIADGNAVWGQTPAAVGFGVSPSLLNRRVSADGFDRAAVFCPAICVTENNICFSVTCELPGVSDKDIDVIWHNGTLAIRGQKRNNNAENAGEVCVSDQIWGQFYRAVSLAHVADCIDTGKITTKCLNGVLEVTLPKVRQSTESYIKVGPSK